VDGDGDQDNFDRLAINGALGTSIDDAGYIANADLDRDGEIENADKVLAGQGFPPVSKTALAAGTLSDPNVGNQIGFDGYHFDVESQLYRVRHRSYDPASEQWLERDPLGYVDGMNLYVFVSQSPSTHLDFSGLQDTLYTRYLDKKHASPGGGPGYEQAPSGCCTITLIVHVPPGQPQSLEDHLDGHTGVGINDDYYDWGPANDIPSQDFPLLLTPQGVPGAPWWDKPPTKTTTDILKEFPIKPYYKGMVAITVFANAAECSKAKDCWDDVYKDYELWINDFVNNPSVPYNAQEQCSSKAVNCLPNTILNPDDALDQNLPEVGPYGPFRRFKPRLVTPRSVVDAANNGKVKHTCGPMSGQPATVNKLN
jgi:RHS repeat-associated protein